MSDVTKYGTLNSEKLAEENRLCRQIVREISTLEISERQRKFLIYLLALELEDIEMMRSVTALVKDLAGKEIFISQDEGENNGSPDASS